MRRSRLGLSILIALLVTSVGFPTAAHAGEVGTDSVPPEGSGFCWILADRPYSLGAVPYATGLYSVTVTADYHVYCKSPAYKVTVTALLHYSTTPGGWNGTQSGSSR